MNGADDTPRLIDAWIQASEARDTDAGVKALHALGKARVGLSHVWDATESRSARIRQAGFQALGNYKGHVHEHIPFLRRGIQDPNSYVQVAATRATARLPVAQLAPKIALLTIHRIPPVRIGAIAALADFPECLSTTRPYIVSRITDNHPAVREATLQAIKRLRDQGFAADLAAALVDVRNTDKLKALPVIKAVGGELCVGHCFALLDIVDQRVSLAAAEAIHAIAGRTTLGDEDVVALARSLHKRRTSNGVGLGITRKLVQTAGTIEALSSELEDALLAQLGGAGGRRAAAVVLSEHKVERARGQIEQILRSDHTAKVQAAMINALGRLGPGPSANVIVDSVQHCSAPDQVRSFVTVARELDDDSRGAIIGTLAASRSHVVRAALIREAVRCDLDEAPDLVSDGLNDATAMVRIAAAHGAAQLQRFGATLHRMREHDDDPEVRKLLSSWDWTRITDEEECDRPEQRALVDRWSFDDSAVGMALERLREGDDWHAKPAGPDVSFAQALRELAVQASELAGAFDGNAPARRQSTSPT